MAKEEKPKFWSQKYRIMACAKCGRSTYRHEGKKLCRPCYQMENERHRGYYRKVRAERDRLLKEVERLKKTK
jgi:hypothetical protein